MISPAPTSKVDAKLARGTFLGLETPPAPKKPFVRLAFANTQYDLHLAPLGPVQCEVGKRILGTIRGEARRVDIVTTGGRYMEPVIGRPRRVQGTVVAIDAASNTLVVDAGAPVHLTLTAPGQKAEKFSVGALVSCDVMDGATFSQAKG
jgi:hypothetical protein